MRRKFLKWSGAVKNYPLDQLVRFIVKREAQKYMNKSKVNASMTSSTITLFEVNMYNCDNVDR